MARRKFIAGNWKENCLLSEAADLVAHRGLARPELFRFSGHAPSLSRRAPRGQRPRDVAVAP